VLEDNATVVIERCLEKRKTVVKEK